MNVRGARIGCGRDDPVDQLHHGAFIGPVAQTLDIAFNGLGVGAVIPGLGPEGQIQCLADRPGGRHRALDHDTVLKGDGVGHRAVKRVGHGQGQNAVLERCRTDARTAQETGIPGEAHIRERAEIGRAEEVEL